MPRGCHALRKDAYTSRRRRGVLTAQYLRRRDTPPEQRERAMGVSDDIRQMSDPDFLAERARVRETIEALQERMAELDDEFLKRAGAAWTEAVQ